MIIIYKLPHIPKTSTHIKEVQYWIVIIIYILWCRWLLIFTYFASITFRRRHNRNNILNTLWYWHRLCMLNTMNIWITTITITTTKTLNRIPMQISSGLFIKLKLLWQVLRWFSIPLIIQGTIEQILLFIYGWYACIFIINKYLMSIYDFIELYCCWPWWYFWSVELLFALYYVGLVPVDECVLVGVLLVWAVLFDVV